MSSINEYSDKKLNKTLTTLLCIFIQKNMKNSEDYLSFIEFTYNRSVHSTTNHLPFKIIYGFNPLPFGFDSFICWWKS
jgi:hypothetical protein